METSQLNEEQLNESLCEVRKAHRLIYEYQRRMQDLTWFIKNKLGFPLYQGYKKYSNPISRNRIWYNMWAWDFIYSYVFEYYFDVQSNNEKKWKLSVTQISDTGYFKNKENGSDQTKTSSYASPEKSETRLLFYLSVVPNSDEFVWSPKDIINSYAGCAELGEIYSEIIESEGKKQVVYSVPLSKFIDEEHTLEILRGFIEYCNNNTGSELKVVE